MPKTNTGRYRPTQQQRLNQHLRAVERIIRPYIVPKGTYALIDQLSTMDIREPERREE